MSTTPVTATRGERRLIAATTLFAFGVLIHNLDHVRRGGAALPADVFWIGTLALLDEAAVVVLVFLRHRLAPLMALVSGMTLAAGYLVVHFTPRRPWLSDSLVSGDASALSIVAASIELVAAIVLTAAALLSLNERSTTPGGTSDLWVGLRHPVVLAMVGGNAFVFVMSLATR